MDGCRNGPDIGTGCSIRHANRIRGVLARGKLEESQTAGDQADDLDVENGSFDSGIPTLDRCEDQGGDGID